MFFSSAEADSRLSFDQGGRLRATLSSLGEEAGNSASWSCFPGAAYLISTEALGDRQGSPYLVQLSCSVMSNSLWPRGLQHARLPCPSPTPGACSNSCPSSWRCHSTISSFVVLFFSCLQSFPASGSFPMNQFFASGGQSIGASALASVLPVAIQDWFPLGKKVLINPYFIEDIMQEPWESGFDLWVGKIPWRRGWRPSPVFLPGESHGQRSLVGFGLFLVVHQVAKSRTRLKWLTHTHTA